MGHPNFVLFTQISLYLISFVVMYSNILNPNFNGFITRRCKYKFPDFFSISLPSPILYYFPLTYMVAESAVC